MDWTKVIKYLRREEARIAKINEQTGKMTLQRYLLRQITDAFEYGKIDK